MTRCGLEGRYLDIAVFRDDKKRHLTPCNIGYGMTVKVAVKQQAGDWTPQRISGAAKYQYPGGVWTE